MDDFGIKYYNKADSNHFQDSLKDHFDFHLDYEGKNYMGLKLDWNYAAGYVDIYMPDYIEKYSNAYNIPHRTVHNTHIMNTSLSYLVVKVHDNMQLLLKLHHHYYLRHIYNM